jgi:hypothetical protein
MAFLVTVLWFVNKKNTQNFSIWHPKDASHTNSIYSYASWKNKMNIIKEQQLENSEKNLGVSI